MREILFRGKAKDSNKFDWIFGDLFKPQPDCTLDPEIRFYYKHEEKYYTIIGLDVIPETVGQYTGLTDKNGKKIFEGDIIQTRKKRLKGEKTFRFVIKYGAYIPLEYCQSMYAQWETIGFYAFDGEMAYQLSNCPQMLEVIGNIHDNPELLKGGD